MSTGQDEIITEEEAAWYLGVTTGHLRELVTQGELRLVAVQKPEGIESMYLISEVLRLKARAGDRESKPGTEE